MTSAFARFPTRLQQAIVSRLGWSSLRPVQELSSHALLDGKNAIILAPTAGGKTEASIFPVLANLIEREPKTIGVIYVAPIKALLNNQAERLKTYTEMVGLRRFVWHGDIKASEKKAFIKEPAHILMTTPESLEVMLLSSKVPHVKLFNDLRAVIVDEIHALAGSDRGTHLISVFERLFPCTDNDVQRIGLSATVGNPQDILQWLQGTSQREGCVIDPPHVPSKKDIRIYYQETTRAIASQASQIAQGQKSLFFCQSRSLAEKIAEQMQERNIDVFVHHSSVSAEERTTAEERFHRGGNTSIICTSTLELGIDVGDLDLVLQANAPSTVSSFLQRLGRTGRRKGQRANTTFFCEDTETVLQAIALIELAKKGWVESVPTNNRVWSVLVHQILALTLQFGAISAEQCWQQLSVIPDFSGISQSEFEYLIAHMVREHFLFLSQGLLSIGDQTEKTFGRRNFMEIYAVFSSPQLYKVSTETGYIIGSLEQNFVDKLVAEMSSFLLSGKAWIVNHISHEDRIVKVIPAPRGKKPTWGGFIPQLLSFEICQEIKELLLRRDRIPYLNEKAQTFLDEWREELNPVLNHSELNIRIEPERVLWWTFAGGQINHTLKYGIQVQKDWKIIADNFKLKIEGNGFTPQSLRQIITNLSTDDFWQDSSTRSFIKANLPNYRLSKFQSALPTNNSLEMVESYLLDISQAIDFVRNIHQ
ncbi:MAG: DEAD/DEAH box helicase [Xenococcaceae cyanobacterium MO_188.B32]|nr:DEAD/DEAH box helicase [Xenococcaceae cyanobacterium MO_188.B32]